MSEWGAEPWYGVDFDGTLVKSGQHGPGEWEPVWSMVKRVREWIAEGRTVHVVTARAHPTFPNRDLWVNDVVQFCVCHLGAALPVRCDKDGGMVELWDDRAVRVVAGEGRDELGDAYDAIFDAVPEVMSLADKVRTLRDMEADALVRALKAEEDAKDLKARVAQLELTVRSRDTISEHNRRRARKFYEDVCRAVGYDPEITCRPSGHVVDLVAEDHAEVVRLRADLDKERRKSSDIIEGRLNDLELWKKDRDALLARLAPHELDAL